MTCLLSTHFVGVMLQRDDMAMDERIKSYEVMLEVREALATIAQKKQEAMALSEAQKTTTKANALAKKVFAIG